MGQHIITSGKLKIAISHKALVLTNIVI